MGSNAITTIIGEHLLIRNGKSSPSRAITGEYPVYGSNGIIGYSDEYNANENTIIIGRVGSYCGSVYISGKKCWVTDNAIIGTAKNENESHFWFYLLKKIDLNNYSTGSGQPLINQTIINTISVTIPKLSEKRVSIGHFLRHFDQKINLSLNINQSLEQMSQTLFKSWFVDFDPVIDNALDAGNPIPEALQSRAELRQKVRSSADFKPLLVEIRSLFPSEFEETELGWVPKGWTLKSVAKSININPSIKLPKNKIAKYVDMKSLPTQGYSISDIIEKPYSGGAKFQNNDTLFARITPCLENGKTGFVDFLDEKETAFGSTEFIVMRGTPQVHYLYVACLARENNFRLHAIQNTERSPHNFPKA
ncbi:restriction endonuclease subunit S [Escherichia coli]|nr:restriction endonuclease subunit S [Escherichia coli]